MVKNPTTVSMYFLGITLTGITAHCRILDTEADVAGRLHTENKVHRLSYADCACLALAMSQEILVLTGDRKWAAIPLDVEMRLFR